MDIGKQTAVAAAVAGLFTVSCGGPSPGNGAPQGAAGKESTITGCLTRGDNGESFIVRAENEPQPQGNERPERPTSAPGVYRVTTGDHTMDVGEHIDARVRLRGHLVTIPVQAAGDANGTLQAAPGGGDNNTKPQDQRTDMIDMKTFRVTAIEKLGNCE
jgi:hypothetical protein